MLFHFQSKTSNIQSDGDRLDELVKASDYCNGGDEDNEEEAVREDEEYVNENYEDDDDDEHEIVDMHDNDNAVVEEDEYQVEEVTSNVIVPVHIKDNVQVENIVVQVENTVVRVEENVVQVAENNSNIENRDIVQGLEHVIFQIHNEDNQNVIDNNIVNVPVLGFEDYYEARSPEQQFPLTF